VENAAGLLERGPVSAREGASFGQPRCLALILFGT
jgi:hypothetical protein